jgi:hypothetical protein
MLTNIAYYTVHTITEIYISVSAIFLSPDANGGI